MKIVSFRTGRGSAGEILLDDDTPLRGVTGFTIQDDPDGRVLKINLELFELCEQLRVDRDADVTLNWATEDILRQLTPAERQQIADQIIALD